MTLRDTLDRLYRWVEIRIATVVTGDSDLGIIESSDGRVYYPNISRNTQVGTGQTNTEPAHMYVFEHDGPAGFYNTSDQFDGVVALNLAGMDPWDDEDAIVDSIALTEIHELTHWAMVGQDMPAENNGPMHHEDWNDVIADVLVHVRGDNCAYGPYVGPIDVDIEASDADSDLDAEMVAESSDVEVQSETES